MRRFGSDPNLIGRTIDIDGRRVEVVGVLLALPLDADILPTLVTVPVFELVMSLPTEDLQRTTHGSENYNILAKMRPDATLEQVETELLTVAAEFVKDPRSLAAGLSPGTEYRIGVVPLLDQVVGGVRTPLLILLGATGLLLLIACANVANLLLTRVTVRRRELSIRAALGAGRPRVVAQSMAEGLILAIAGGIAGVGMALAGIRALHRAAPEDLPRLGDVAVDPAVLAFAAGLCLATSLLFGLGPALRISSVPPQEALREMASAVRARSLWRGTSRYLVIARSRCRSCSRWGPGCSSSTV